VFAGQRDEGFYIDVGGVFDTLKLRSISADGGGDSTAGFNVNTIAIEVPIQELTRSGAVPNGPTSPDAVIGVWAVSSRQKISVLRSSFDDDGEEPLTAGPMQQVSRLGSPLVNELIIPLKLKDRFNASTPEGDSQFAQFVTNPQLAQLLVRCLVFPFRRGRETIWWPYSLLEFRLTMLLVQTSRLSCLMESHTRCCASTLRFRLRRVRAVLVCSVETSRAFRMDAECLTTS
jgi:hypothetical protein